MLVTRDRSKQEVIKIEMLSSWSLQCGRVERQWKQPKVSVSYRGVWMLQGIWPSLLEKVTEVEI